MYTIKQRMHLGFVCPHDLSNCAWRGLQLGCSTSPGRRAPLAPKRTPRKPRDSWPVLATHVPMKAVKLIPAANTTIAQPLHRVDARQVHHKRH